MHASKAQRVPAKCACAFCWPAGARAPAAPRPPAHAAAEPLLCQSWRHAFALVHARCVRVCRGRRCARMHCAHAHARFTCVRAVCTCMYACVRVCVCPSTPNCLASSGSLHLPAVHTLKSVCVAFRPVLLGCLSVRVLRALCAIRARARSACGPSVPAGLTRPCCACAPPPLHSCAARGLSRIHSSTQRQSLAGGLSSSGARPAPLQAHALQAVGPQHPTHASHAHPALTLRPLPAPHAHARCSSRPGNHMAHVLTRTAYAPCPCSLLSSRPGDHMAFVLTCTACTPYSCSLLSSRPGNHMAHVLTHTACAPCPYSLLVQTWSACTACFTRAGVSWSRWAGASNWA